jgi:hypothetical protein
MNKTENSRKHQINRENLLPPDTLNMKVNFHAAHTDKLYMEPNLLMPEPKMALFLLPGEHQDIRVDANIMLANGDDWLSTPNTCFGGRSPASLIGTADESLLRETLRSAICSGMA